VGWLLRWWRGRNLERKYFYVEFYTLLLVLTDSFVDLLDTLIGKSMSISPVQLILFVDGQFEHLKARKRGFRKK
jgi:hypothetical protein